MKLTAAAAKTLALPEGKTDHIYFDDELPGFGLRLRASGTRKWVVQYDFGGRTRRLLIGPVALIEPNVARKRAKDILAARTLGRDSTNERREARTRAAETFGAIMPRYLAVQQRETRPRTHKETRYRLERLAKPLHSCALRSIDRKQIASLISTVTERNGSASALALHGTLSGFFSWAMREGLLDSNPAINTNRPERVERTRLLSEEELRVLWGALGDDDYSDIVRLLILTAARRAEIGDLRWSEVDLDAAMIEIPGERMKNHKPHLIPLSEPALVILRKRRGARTDQQDHVFGRGGFQHWSQARKALDARIGGARPDWVLHDLRRLASTVLHERLHVPPHIVERLLAHVGHQRGIAGTYNRAEYLSEKRRALEKWADWVLTVAGGTTRETPAKVVQLK
jgi:integrase